MKSRTIIAAAAALCIALTGCASQGGSSGGSSNNPYDLIKAGTLTACSDSPYEPFEYEDSSTPTGYTGFDIDIMQAVADKLGLTLSVVDSDFNMLQSGVLFASGKCDVGASALTITDERKENTDFSDPYYTSLQSLLVPKGSTLATMADLDGKKVGVQAGTTGEIYTKDQSPNAVLTAYPSDAEMWLAIQAGQVDALVQDLPVNNVHAKADPDYVISGTFDTGEQYGFTVEKGTHADLLAAINTQLAAMKADGSYDALYKKYFG